MPEKTPIPADLLEILLRYDDPWDHEDIHEWLVSNGHTEPYEPQPRRYPEGPMGTAMRHLDDMAIRLIERQIEQGSALTKALSKKSGPVTVPGKSFTIRIAPEEKTRD